MPGHFSTQKWAYEHDGLEEIVYAFEPMSSIFMNNENVTQFSEPRHVEISSFNITKIFPYINKISVCKF